MNFKTIWNKGVAFIRDIATKIANSVKTTTKPALRGAALGGTILGSAFAANAADLPPRDRVLTPSLPMVEEANDYNLDWGVVIGLEGQAAYADGFNAGVGPVLRTYFGRLHAQASYLWTFDLEARNSWASYGGKKEVKDCYTCGGKASGYFYEDFYKKSKETNELNLQIGWDLWERSHADEAVLTLVGRYSMEDAKTTESGYRQITGPNFNWASEMSKASFTRTNHWVGGGFEYGTRSWQAYVVGQKNLSDTKYTSTLGVPSKDPEYRVLGGLRYGVDLGKFGL